MAIDITEIRIEAEAVAYLKSCFLARRILQTIKESGQDYLTGKQKSQFPPYKQEEVEEALKKLEEFGMIHEVAGFYNLTFLGGEIVITLAQRLLSKLPPGILGEIRILRRAYAQLRKQREIESLSHSDREELKKELEFFKLEAEALLTALQS